MKCSRRVSKQPCTYRPDQVPRFPSMCALSLADPGVSELCGPLKCSCKLIGLPQPLTRGWAHAASPGLDYGRPGAFVQNRKAPSTCPGAFGEFWETEPRDNSTVNRPRLFRCLQADVHSPNLHMDGPARTLLQTPDAPPDPSVHPIPSDREIVHGSVRCPASRSWL